MAIPSSAPECRDADLVGRVLGIARGDHTQRQAQPPFAMPLEKSLSRCSYGYWRDLVRPAVKSLRAFRRGQFLVAAPGQEPTPDLFIRDRPASFHIRQSFVHRSKEFAAIVFGCRHRSGSRCHLRRILSWVIKSSGFEFFKYECGFRPLSSFKPLLQNRRC